MAFPDLVIVKLVCWPVTISCVSPRRPGENGFYQTSGHLINGLPGRRFFFENDDSADPERVADERYCDKIMSIALSLFVHCKFSVVVYAS